MKYIKKFENNNKLSVGDYVAIKTSEHKFTRLYNEFLESHIGKVDNIDGDFFHVVFSNNKYYTTTHFDIHEEFHISDIKCYAKTLDELKIKIEAYKYNL